MAAFNKFNCFVQDVGRGLHNLNSDVLKDMVTNTAPVATNTVYSNLTDLSTANGYTAGGTTIGSTAYSQTSGTATLSGGNTVITATGAVGPFRYVAAYNNTSATKPLIGWWDYGSSVTLANGETFTTDHSANILTIA